MKVAADGVTYDFDENRFLNVEFIAIERATGMTAVQWQHGLNSGSAMACTALIWICRRRAGEPTLRFDDVEFEMDTLDMNPGGVNTPKAPEKTTSPESVDVPTILTDTSPDSSESLVSVPGN
jgi:hypothetical protein